MDKNCHTSFSGPTQIVASWMCSTTCQKKLVLLLRNMSRNKLCIIYRICFYATKLDNSKIS